MRPWFKVIYFLLYPFFKLAHPIKAVGLERLPEGGMLLCANHTKASDPFFIIFSLGLKRRISAMAKAEIMKVPVVGSLLKKAGIIGVERGKSDVGAIKAAMKFLKAGGCLIMFPEGTRVAEGKEEEHEAKTGAAMLATRTGVPIVPVYIPRKKNWFRPTTIVIGEAYYPQFKGARATQEDYRVIADDLMERIFTLGEQVKNSAD